MNKVNLINAEAVVAVGSCKGGVGKTTIAVNLAMALRRDGLKVGLFDADLYGPNIPLMLGIRRRETRLPLMAKRGINGKGMQFIPLYNKDGKQYMDPVRKFGLETMSLGFWFGEKEVTKDSGLLGGQLVQQVLRDVRWPELDILIIDLPPGTGQLLQVLLASVAIDGIVVITTPQEMALLDTSRSVRFFRECGVPVLGRVANMNNFACPKCGERTDIFEDRTHSWRDFDDISFLGSVPLDLTLGRAIDADHPFTQLKPDTPAANSIKSIARAMLKRLSDNRTG